MDQERRAINDLDRRIAELLQERAGLAQRIGQLKAEQQRSAFDAAREAEVLSHVAETTGPLTAEQLRGVFSEVISACRALEQPLRVAYLGPAHSFSHQAARRRFGEQAELVPAADVTEIFHLVEAEQCPLGVAPVENSTGGVVAETLDCLLESPLQICGELLLAVHLCLLGSGDLAQARTLYSHPQPLAQCRRWLRENLPGVETIVASSTVAAAEQAAQDPTGVALAPEAAAQACGLRVLAANVEDVPTNRTRFFLLAREGARPTGRDKTSVAFSTPHRSGALHEALGTFSRYGLNLTLIQSRPWLGQPWQYVFFVDFVGHREEAATQAALAELHSQCSLVKVLGSYPAEES